MFRKLDKKIIIPGLLGMLVVLVAAVAQFERIGWLRDIDQRLEWLVYDQRIRALLNPTLKPDPRIVIVDVDEKSLRALGQWPWPRSRLAELVDKLVANQVAVIGTDIVFAEAQRTLLSELDNAHGYSLSAATQAELQQVSKRMDNDQHFAESLSRSSTVLGYTFSDTHDAPTGLLPEPIYPMMRVAPEDLMVKEYPGYIANINPLQDAAGSAGFFTIEPDEDGIIRRAFILIRHDGDLYESLSLAMVRKAFAIDEIELEVDDRQSVETITLGEKFTIPLDVEGCAIIPYRGRAKSFPYVSAADVIKGTAPRAVLENAIVLIGVTAAGLYDLRATPVQSVYPGVEIHANLIAGILDANIPSEPPWAPGANLAVIVCLGFLVAWIFPLLGPVGMLLASLFTIVAIITATTWLWLNQGFLLASANPILMVMAVTSFNFAYGFLIEDKGRRKLKAVFGQYVPPERVEEMSRNPNGAFGVDGESREMSVLFCDIRNFTSISEKLAADELKRMLNFFFTPMTKIIFEEHGTIDKYVGDMIMAFWGAPLIDTQHNLNAVNAALKMLAAVDSMGDELERRGWPRLNTGIGINSGLMNVGDMGSEYRRSYTVIGDAVNLGSRLEGLTKYYGVQLIVSETTRAGLNSIVFKHLDKVRVKGKHEPVSIYEPLCNAEAASPELIQEVESYHQALECYFNARWTEAQQRFEALAQARPDSVLYKLYRQRVNELSDAGITADWDGVYTHSSK